MFVETNSVLCEITCWNFCMSIICWPTQVPLKDLVRCVQIVSKVKFLHIFDHWTVCFYSPQTANVPIVQTLAESNWCTDHVCGSVPVCSASDWSQNSPATWLYPIILLKSLSFPIISLIKPKVTRNFFHSSRFTQLWAKLLLMASSIDFVCYQANPIIHLCVLSEHTVNLNNSVTKSCWMLPVWPEVKMHLYENR